MKSIMGSRKGECYLCRLLLNDGIPTNYDVYTEEHHAIMGANRRLSEKYGLKVYLCPEHHRTGKDAVHTNYEICRFLQMKAQIMFQATYPDLDFREIFGKNYL